MKITVDRNRCVGAGNCVLAADELFEQDESNGRVKLLRSEPPQEMAEMVEEAELMCPSRAISVAFD
ncbi:ferredoxin [Streptomyces armeniacus]|uniref:Ferredoxin n=1 Tax=Streptomyces armeniacus TaxID=83291 RepID=A0A345XY52_9ACTN|nr:ferredoxin [Streptomyces armeniacus]AXK36568.1 ferredoxin [Streptomyces armeniacus]QIQ28619.1 Nbc23 [Streptomyces sp.]